jgi:hypothetical protein
MKQWILFLVAGLIAMPAICVANGGAGTPAPDGTILKEGKVGGCINCHTGVKANDWLFTGPIK